MPSLTEFFRPTHSCFLSPTHPHQAAPPSPLPATQVKKNRHQLRDFLRISYLGKSLFSRVCWFVGDMESSEQLVFKACCQNLKHFLLLNWTSWIFFLYALEITINDWLPQISLPLWMTLAQRSRHSVIEVWPRLLWPVDQHPYFGDMQNHPRIWQFADQHINCSPGYLVKSSPCMVILWSILW